MVAMAITSPRIIRVVVGTCGMLVDTLGPVTDRSPEGTLNWGMTGTNCVTLTVSGDFCEATYSATVTFPSGFSRMGVRRSSRLPSLPEERVAVK
jgi:hypothetical protein